MRATVFFFCTLVFIACNQKKDDPTPAAPAAVAEAPDTIPNFFPVTSFLKGQIYEIKSIGIAPVKKTTIGTHTDSAYVKTENLEAAFADFLSPVIDTANLKDIFTEKKFLDQTLNAFTFTYDPLEGKADSFAFRHWDVYVDPETNKVTRIYMIRKAGPSKELQLTWQCGKWCRIVTVNTSGNGSVEKEEKISWTYE